MNELALFAGAGGGILGGKLLGWRTICAVEIDSYCASVLVARQNDGILAPFPIWDDVRTFDGRPWRGIVDVISGGFPCQDISCAGKREGINGHRSGLWGEMARIIGEVGPRYVFVENVPTLTLRGGTRVIGDFTALGFHCRWGVVSAADAGAPHLRERIWIVADAGTSRVSGTLEAFAGRDIQPVLGESQPAGQGIEYPKRHNDVADADGRGCEERSQFNGEEEQSTEPASQRNYLNGFCDSVPNANRQSLERTSESWSQCRQWESEPDVGRVADGVAARVDKLRCLGNGQVPGVAALAWRILSR